MSTGFRLPCLAPCVGTICFLPLVHLQCKGILWRWARSKTHAVQIWQNNKTKSAQFAGKSRRSHSEFLLCTTRRHVLRFPGGTMQKSFFEGCTRRILSCGGSINHLALWRQVHPPKVKGSSPFQATALSAVSEIYFLNFGQKVWKANENVKR